MNPGFDVPMTCDLSEEAKRPYFFWDESTTIAKLRETLRGEDLFLQHYYTAKIMREARYEDVWKFVSLDEVRQRWGSLRTILGRRRGFWEFLFSVWKRNGIVPAAFEARG